MSNAGTVVVDVKVKSIAELTRDHSLRMKAIAGLAADVDSMMTQAFQAAAADLGPTNAQAVLDAARDYARERVR